MRKITAGLFISLDGVVEAPDQWHFPYFNEEMGAAVDATLGAADTILFGRKTYDSFAGAWPEREAAGAEDAPFAKKLGDARKIVVSNQQLDFTWRNSEQLEGDLIDAVTAFRNSPGVVDLEHRDVGHEAVGCSAVPVLFAGLEEDAVAGTDHLDRSAAALSATDALDDVDRLAVRVGVPCGARAGGEVNAACTQARAVRRRRDSVDVDRASEPVARPAHGFDAAPRDLHVV